MHATPSPPLHIGSDECRTLLSSRETQGRICVLEWRGHGEGGPPLHLHEDQDEVFMIEAGDFLFQLGDAQQRLRAGDTVFVPRGKAHAFRQLSTSGRMRYLYTPAGRMEDFFVALAGCSGPPEPAQAEALFAAHDMRLLGPPLAAPLA